MRPLHALWLLATLFLAVVLARVWWTTPPKRARSVKPLLAEMDAYRATNGAYPTSCLSLASFSQLTQHFRVYTGARVTNTVIWDPSEVSHHDITVLVDSPGYELFVPVGRMKSISFSSFPVWRLDSADHHWRKGRIHWSYGGTYWSLD